MVNTITGKQNRIYELLREKSIFRLLSQRKDVKYNACRRLCQNMVNTITGKQNRIDELLCEKGIFHIIIRRRDQTILLLQQQILFLQNNPLPNINIAAI